MLVVGFLSASNWGNANSLQWVLSAALSLHKQEADWKTFHQHADNRPSALWLV
jgi:hypothetical protein